MRYYIYLDKCFVRSLFSVLNESDFNIEVVEYSVRKSSTTNNQVSIDPYLEKLCNNDKVKNIEGSKNRQKRYGSSNAEKNGINGNLGYANSSTVETVRRYINIDDITDMKNNSFYHNLVEKLNKENNRSSNDDERIAIESGFIELYDLDDKLLNSESKIDGFFKINTKNVWYKKELLQGDIKLLAQMSCRIKVIGYTMSCLEKEDRIIKAIAVFIE